MTRIFNDPALFASEMLEGFILANSHKVRGVTGGVVRSTRSASNTVAVIVGGGAGHYPAFGGLVGPGLAHGAAMGNIFASPSAQQIYSVAMSANRGRGILLTYGNYAGDVLNFDSAQSRLTSEGIEVRTVVVSDDIASASPAEKNWRRGIAGGFAVYKVAGAASEAGYSLDDVAQVAGRANERTRSFGVAFTGCTLPGATAPLFTVPSGRIALGMGIHGEPGIGEMEMPTAEVLAQVLVSRLLTELPQGVKSPQNGRVGLILNGLGSVKYEELFVLYRGVAKLLRDADITIVDPEVGEVATSFEMAGVSLSLFWLDEELEKFWRAPADTPAFHKVSFVEIDRDPIEKQAQNQVLSHEGSLQSREASATAVRAFAAIASTIDECVAELGRLDAVAGDGDHGIGMQRGSHAAFAAAEQALLSGAGVRTTFERAGAAWSDHAGGTSGALWGAALGALASVLSDSSAPEPVVLADGIEKATSDILRFGAAVGDKTMVDVLVPFSQSFRASVANGNNLNIAWEEAADVAARAAAATSGMVAKVGRARLHAKKSIGAPDAGAYSLALILVAVSAVLRERS